MKSASGNTWMNSLSLLTRRPGFVMERFTQKLSMKDPKTFVGIGKLNEIAQYVKGIWPLMWSSSMMN
jgi:50S ribosomal subunit-associated GTPase HflX